MATLSTLRQRRTELELEWSRWLAGRPSGADLRSEVVESWTRSLSTVDPGRDSAPVLDDVRPRWSSSPLRRPVAELSDELRSIADDAGFIAAVTDESGTILWTCGGRVMRRRAERVNFAPGGRWGEEAMGTNALSLALRTGRPASIFSAEHLVEALHGWCCWSAPIRDASGRTLGVLDLSTTWDRAHPLAMSTVRTLVTTIETRLHATMPTPDGVSLTCLGRGHATLDGAALRLSPRQLELLALFALEPGGFSLDQLREALYGDSRVSSNTLRAEVSHLRRVLGGALANRRYALTRPISCDAVEVLTALKAGDAATAVERYTGPLLPDSEAPGVTAWREQLEVAVREAVLASPDPALALRYGERHPYDLQIHEHAHAALPAGDPRRALAAARLRLALRD
ncbi:winged helix-turn-helix domain-containing protein [Amycolatopsis cynarae]|uniref:Winged helix-turn-helix domain-containing protein n=1 Tax=Amycolatopsis cynarae TaxID=2995223 RepID=A0ABY7B133_9PSEU|nr:winged helix-turn-helix domain-containing protein [Amycolatopsis sp. HUAS 11-8]WAL64621.1 winged helix-turn-helix domain-containing protein [Amycolatopsis sp. HUAS 11-8]